MPALIALALSLAMPGCLVPVCAQDSPRLDFQRPDPAASLKDLYPTPPMGVPFTAGQNDPGLTDEQRSQSQSIKLDPIPANQMLPIGGGRLPPIRLEATFNEPLSLRQTLSITLHNNLPLRISRAGYDAQRYLLWSALGQFVPDMTLTYRGQQVKNQNSPASSLYTNSATVRYPVFQGGGVFYNSLVSFYRTRAQKSAYYASVNDALLDAYRRYYDLILNQTLLQIRVKSVELSRAQLKLNQQLKDAGVGTNFAVYQSRTQLALDKQALLQQQVLFRQSALALAFVLNTNMAINLVPEETMVREMRLVNQETDIKDLVAAAVKLRPELKQFENLRLAANRNVQVQAAPLYPTFQFFTSITETSSTRRSGGGSSTSGLAGSTVIIPSGSGGGIGISGGGGRSVSAGFDLSWNLDGMGIPTVSNALSARALARQALLQSNVQYQTVMQQVRSSYLNMLTAKEQVYAAAETLVSSAEALRLANLRVTYGQGINLELIQAQRDYITALSTHAQSIIAFNVSQAQLLRDTGQITIETLTSELKQPIGMKPHSIKLHL